MSDRDHPVEPVDADELVCCSTTKGEASQPARLDRRVGLTRRDAESTREQRGADRRCCDTRIAKEASRVRERLDRTLIGAAERGHRAHGRQAKLIVKDSEVTANNRLRRGHPREADTRSKIFLGYEFRVVIPTKTEVQRQVVQEAPIVLHI